MEEFKSNLDDATAGGSFEQLDTLDLTNTDTDYPVLKEGAYRFSVKSLKIVDSKKTQGNKNAEFRFALMSSGMCENGKPANHGLVITERVSLQAVDNYDPQVRLAQIQLCFFGFKGKVKWSEAIGKEGDLRIKVEESKEYGRQNRVSNFIPKSANAPVATI